jgi:hypothetical protein
MSQTLAELESEVLREGREWTRRRLEQRLQAHANELTACPESGLVLKRLRRHCFTLQTVSGTIAIRAPYGFSTQTRKWVCPARLHWDLEAHQRLSPAFEQRLAYNAAATGSYEKAAAMAGCWGSEISDDAIHALVERLGARAALLDAPPASPRLPAPAFILVIMMDGWMVRERGAQWGAPPQTVTTERVAWHEVKSAVIYRLADRAENASGRGLLIQKNVVACAPGTEPLEFGAAVQKEAIQCGLASAKEVLVVADGAVWIWRLITDRFPTATATLDFYHASGHLWELAHHLYPEHPEAAAQWVKPLLHQLRHDPDHRLLESLEKLLTPTTPQSLPDPLVEREVEYFRPHGDHLQYASLAARGAPIGSGAMESACSQFQDRLKRRGQFWTRKGLRNLLLVDVAVKNCSLAHLWN